MISIRKRLTYANVMSSLAVFLLLAGGTAIAAKQLGKKTVGAKQLKSNAVTTAKIKKAAVTKAKIKNGAIDNTKLADNAVTSAKIADGSVAGVDINTASAPFSQITARLRNANSVPYAGVPLPYPVGTYTQSVGNDDQYLGAMDITFGAACTQPRVAQAFLLLDAANPSVPVIGDIAGLALVQDTGAGAVTRRLEFAPLAGSSPMSRMSPLNATPHTFTAVLQTVSCTAGSGASISGAQLDVISTK